MGSGPQTGKGRGIAVSWDATDFDQIVAACFPWHAVMGSPALNPVTGFSDTHRRERPGPCGHLVPAGRNQPRAARRRSALSRTAPSSRISGAAAPLVTADLITTDAAGASHIRGVAGITANERAQLPVA